MHTLEFFLSNRPHPAVWRVVHGFVVIYLLIVVFMLFLTADQARQLLKVSSHPAPMYTPM